MMFLLSSIVQAAPSECAQVEPLPEAVQVAWISPKTDTVRSGKQIEVVHLQALQQWMADEDVGGDGQTIADREASSDAKALLHQMGMLSKRSKKYIDPNDYKVTIFDVESSTLCRPIDVDTEENTSAATVVEGLGVCEQRSSKPAALYSRYGFTGCGYTKNTQTQEKGFDVYRVTWADASTWGFCVLPLSRFLMGAPQ